MAEKSPDPKPLSATEAARRVKRKPNEVLSFKDYGTHVVVVTTDGQKLTDRAQ